MSLTPIRFSCAALLIFGITFLTFSIVRFLRLKKALGNEIKTPIFSFYLALLFFFELGYLFQFILSFWRQNILVCLIYFFGSLFAYISIYLLERMIHIVQTNRASSTDPMTNLFNKQALQQQITFKLEEKTTIKHSCLIMLDLDNFKNVNDQFGHLTGDEVIQKTASILRNHFPCQDLVARIGGDEYLVYTEAFTAKTQVQSSLEQLQSQLYRQVLSAWHCVHLSCSIGVAFYSEDIHSYATYFHHADMAMYQAKKAGKNKIVIYDQM